MITAGDFRNGVTFDMDGNVFQIIEFQHVKPGKGAAFVRTKIRNVISGAVVEKLSTQPISSQPHSSKEKIWNTSTTMVICTTSWIRNPTKQFRSTEANSVKHSNS